jgi:hypothetical protein
MLKNSTIKREILAVFYQLLRFILRDEAPSTQ